MTFLDDVRHVVEDEGNKPSWHYQEALTDLSDEDVTVVEDSDTGAYSRWSNVNRAVLRRGDEYVAVVYNEPATENQDWSDWSSDEVEVYAVTPVEVTTVEYRKA